MIHQIFNTFGTHIYNGTIYENFHFEYNFHNSFELYYIFKGTPYAFVNDIEIPLSPGDFLLIAPNMAHNLVDENENIFYTGVFSADFVNEFSRTGKIKPFYKFTTDALTTDFLLANLIKTNSPPLYILKACLYTVCAKAVENDISSNNNFVIDSSFVLAVNNYISGNLDTTFTRKQIADSLNYEEHYFSYLFKKHFNMNLKKYINILRIYNAQRLLSTTTMNISSIATECGFSSIRNFNIVFKNISGKTPNEYRTTNILVTEPDFKNSKIVIPRSHNA